jgi:hypothetical protein
MAPWLADGFVAPPFARVDSRHFPFDSPAICSDWDGAAWEGIRCFIVADSH